MNKFKREGCHFLVNSSSKKRRRATIRQIVVSFAFVDGFSSDLLPIFELEVSELIMVFHEMRRHVASTNGVLRPNVSVSFCEFFWGGHLHLQKMLPPVVSGDCLELPLQGRIQQHFSVKNSAVWPFPIQSGDSAVFCANFCWPNSRSLILS